MIFFVLAAALTIEDKEDFCLLLSAKYVKSRSDEIDEYIKNTPSLKIPAIRAKLYEDSFNACVDEPELDKYAEDLVLKLFDKYKSILKVPLGQYRFLEDIKVSTEFSKRRPELQRRAMMRPRSFKDL